MHKRKCIVCKTFKEITQYMQIDIPPYDVYTRICHECNDSVDNSADAVNSASSRCDSLRADHLLNRELKEIWE